MQSPDVTVVVAVYNTMPYVTKCLTSLVGQTIGLDRMEVVAVDDGSTDGSGAELDRFAARYPRTVKVLHQANSGGPAAPSNRALEVATGRYVFFVGSDDYLGPQALERMVRHADAYGSDVLAVRMAGVNDRWVPRDLFNGDHPDVDLFTSSLPFALSNTKLFRRELIEQHHIRYPEDLPVGSDQPFTLEACVRAARISVVSDYEYYYAVKRKNAGNITFRSSAELRLECTEKLMEFTARLLPPGPQRDAINHRHLHTELCRLLRPEFVDHDRAVQERLCAGIGRLVKEHLNDSISRRLDVSRRLRLQLAAAGYLDALIAVIRQNAAPGRTPLVAEGDAVYAAYPCFRDPELALPDDWFLVTNDPAEAVVRGLEVIQIAFLRKRGQAFLGVVAHSSSSADRVAANPVALAAGSAAGVATTTPVTATSAEVTLRAAVGLGELIADALSGGQRFWVLARPDGSASRFVPLYGQAGLLTGWQLVWRGRRPYIVRARTRKDHQLVIDIVPITVGKIVGRVRRMIPAAAQRKTPGGRKNS